MGDRANLQGEPPETEAEAEAAEFQRDVENNFRHNAMFTILNGAFWLYSDNFIARQTILPLYVSHFTDSQLLIGLLSTIAMAGWFLPQIFTVNWVQRLPRKKVVPVRVGLFTERLPMVLMVPAAYLATRQPTLALGAFFVLYAWHVVGNGVVGVGFQDMLAKVLPIDRRGRVRGASQFVGTAGSVLSTAAAGWLIARYGFPNGYVLCFAAAAGLTFVSWFFLALVREPPQASKPAFASQHDYWRRLPSVVRDDPNFRRYLISRLVINTGGMATGFLALYATQRWHLPASQTATFAASILVGQAASNLLCGVLADRYGNKLVMLLSALCASGAVVLASLAPAPVWFYAVFALVGVGMAGLQMSGSMIVMEFTDPRMRPVYIGVNNTVVGISAGVAPIVGGWIATVGGYQALFIVTVIAGLAGLVLLQRSVREPRLAVAPAQHPAVTD